MKYTASIMLSLTGICLFSLPFIYCLIKDITLVTLRGQFGNFGIYFIMTSGLISIFLSYKLAKSISDKGDS